MDQIHVTLPDGKALEVPKGTTPADIARKISPRLADAALVARITATNGVPGVDASGPAEGELIDLRRPLEHDVKLQILTDKDADALYVFRHSAAHLLAAAVMELYPNVKLGIGPPIDTGFFYEFLRDEPFTPDDLAKIEKKMHELAAQDLPNERKLLAQTRGARSCTRNPTKFSNASSSKKKPTTRWFPSTPPENSSTSAAARIFLPPSASSLQIDECRRRLLEGPGRQSPAAAHLRRRFFTQKELDAYLHRLEEAKRRDHRKLGVELDLFSIQEEAGPGLIFWHPKGGLIRKLIENWLRDELLRRGYDLVFTPHIMLLRPLENLRPRRFLQATTCLAPSKSKKPITSSSP